MKKSRVLVVGAGPASLACMTALACWGLADDVEVVDPSGGWLTAWNRRFAAQDIEHLRSPAVHHPHPDPFALLEQASSDDLIPAGGTKLPTTACFSRFVSSLDSQLGVQDQVTTACVESLDVDHDGQPTVHLSDGSTRKPDRLVLATNRREPVVPAPMTAALRAGDVCTTDAADVADTPNGGHVAIVGGGLSAGHLALGATKRGATVTLITRRRIMVRRFDTHPSWLGPKKRQPFEQEPDAMVRRRAIDHARGGGSMPHKVRRALQQAEADGALRLLERAHITAVSRRGSRTYMRFSDGAEVAADAVWLATGGAVDVASDPLCRPLADAQPATVADGLADLEPDLCWPGTRVHLVGASAGLVLGPTSGNLIGHRRAASRIAASMRGADPTREDRIVTGRHACPSYTGPSGTQSRIGTSGPA